MSQSQNSKWQHVSFQLKKKLKMYPSAGKVMCTAFWDWKGVILLDFLEPRQTINSDRCIMTLPKPIDLCLFNPVVSNLLI